MSQQFAVPQILPVAEIMRGSAQIALHSGKVLRLEPGGTSGPLALVQRGETSGVEAMDPALDRDGVLSQQLRGLQTTQPVRNQQNAM